MPRRSSTPKPPASTTAKPRGPRTRDVNELARFIVDTAAGETPAEERRAAERASSEGKNPAAVALGKLGGKKGGKARAAALTPEQRQEIAKLAASARWKKGQ